MGEDLQMGSPTHKPLRLRRIHEAYGAPLYAVTFCTTERRAILAQDAVHHAFQQFGQQALNHGSAFGRYVIMPDHIHCFVRLGPTGKLGTTMRLLKRGLSAAITAPLPHWQSGFFDHLVRHCESYSEQWNYFRLNPVRAGLVTEPNDWPYQGQIVDLRY